MSKNLILHIPHSSNIIPDKVGYVVDDEKLEAEKLLLTDWHTADLFSYANGIPIVAPFNRLWCDVERFIDDNDEPMAQFGMGVIYTKCDDGSELRDVSDELRAMILNKHYHVHHQRLNAAVNEQLSTYGRALIIDCHSFSDKPFKRDLRQQDQRPDICIGTDEFHTPESLYNFSETYFKSFGYSVMINSPYTGTIVPMEYYQKDNRVESIMIEVNRDLYLVPGTNKKGEVYNKIKRVIKNYLEKIQQQ